MSIVFNGQKVDWPNTVSYLDDPSKVPSAIGNTNPRHADTAGEPVVRGFVIHTVHGHEGHLRPGLSPVSTRDLEYARADARHRDEGQRSWDFTVDTDGSVAWSTDPARRFSWHAMQVNPNTAGCEFVQEWEGDMWSDAVDAGARLVVATCRRLGIQLQMPWKDGKPYRGMLSRALFENGSGARLVGIYGHRNVWKRNESGTLVAMRGAGDPTDFPFLALEKLGVEKLDMEAGEDIEVWKKRQRDVCGFAAKDCDGIPGGMTRRALLAKGYPGGIWVKP